MNTIVFYLQNNFNAGEADCTIKRVSPLISVNKERYFTARSATSGTAFISKLFTSVFSYEETMKAVAFPKKENKKSGQLF